MSITQQELRPALPEDATLAPTLSFIEGRWVKAERVSPCWTSTPAKCSPKFPNPPRNRWHKR